MGACRAGTGLVESAITTNRSAAPATVPYLMNCVVGKPRHRKEGRASGVGKVGRKTERTSGPFQGRRRWEEPYEGAGRLPLGRCWEKSLRIYRASA